MFSLLSYNIFCFFQSPPTVVISPLEKYHNRQNVTVSYNFTISVPPIFYTASEIAVKPT
nr:MAG TPA_asm: hypothetical protein [Caudoviricetes sp.]